MNTMMWTSPFTSRHLDVIVSLGARGADRVAGSEVSALSGSHPKEGQAMNRDGGLEYDAELVGLSGDSGGAVTVLSPICKTLACGDAGMGAMAPVESVAEAVKAALARRGFEFRSHP